MHDRHDKTPLVQKIVSVWSTWLKLLTATGSSYCQRFQLPSSPSTKGLQRCSNFRLIERFGETAANRSSHDQGFCGVHGIAIGEGTSFLPSKKLLIGFRQVTVVDSGSRSVVGTSPSPDVRFGARIPGSSPFSGGNGPGPCS